MTHNVAGRVTYTEMMMYVYLVYGLILPYWCVQATRLILVLTYNTAAVCGNRRLTRNDNIRTKSARSLSDLSLVAKRQNDFAFPILEDENMCTNRIFLHTQLITQVYSLKRGVKGITRV